MLRTAFLLTASLLALTAANAALAGPSAVDVCHRNGVITVAAAALDGHLGHGDSLAGSFYADADGDGAGAGSAARCPAPGLVDDASDCDDENAAVHPGGAEVPLNGIDDDCDPTTGDDVDADGDGVESAQDCDDGNATTYPGAPETCDDAVDNNCDGAVDEGCLAECPCFTEDDIINAYAKYLERADSYETSSELCFDYDTQAQTEDGYTEAGLSFGNSTYTFPEGDVVLDQQYNTYFAYGYDITSEQHSCSAFSSDLTYNFTTGVYEHAAITHTVLSVTIEERRGCEARAIETALALGMTCTVL